MLYDENNSEARAATYRENATTLRRLAAQIGFDFCRRDQLLALAAGFDRLAERVEGSCMKEAAD